jgi:hypothetical protein
MDAGLVPPGPRLRIERPIPGAIARFTANSIAVTMHKPLFDTYEAPADEWMLCRARKLDGVLLGVTHALHVDEVTLETLVAVTMSGQLLMGWVGRDGVEQAQM